MISTRLFKAHNFANRVISYQNEESASIEVPGAYYDDALSVNNTKGVKTGWNMEFFNNGIVDREFIYGKGKRTEFRNILNKPVKEVLCQENHYGGIGQQGYLLNDFQRMTLYNKLTDDYGWYNLGDALFGDVVYSKTDISFTLRSNFNIPSDDKITALKNEGIIDKDLTVHGVFPKFKSPVPHIRTYKPDNQQGSQICSSFWYRRAMITDFNAYQDWHNLIWIKKPGEDLHINRRGGGRNFLVPFRNMNFMEPDNRRNVPVQVGQPIALESSLINVRKEDYGFILHVHQINTDR
tara:strand:- start:724 stop:1605 length:882 start_codon:yes stop_codon:yes gene_type:complete